MKNKFFFIFAVVSVMSLSLMVNPGYTQVFFEDDFNDGGTAGALERGWEFIENEFVTEEGSFFVIAPEWPVREPNSSTGILNPPTVDGTASDGGFLISDSDAGGGSDDIGSQAEIYAISPVFSTEGTSEVWFHADTEIENNNNGECVMEFMVTADGGETWISVFQGIEPERVIDSFNGGGVGRDRTDGWPELGSASHTKSFGGIHGRWHLQLPDEVVNKPEVRFRIGYYESADAWWIAMDNVVVDASPPPMGSEVILSEDFENGIPETWSNTTAKETPTGEDQLWDTRPIWDEDFDEPYKFSESIGLAVNIDLVREAESFDLVLDLDNPDANFNPKGILDGRWVLMLAGQGYAMWQEGDLDQLNGVSEGANLDTPVLDCSNYTGVYLAFDSEVLVGNSTARYEVYVSADGGASFDRLFTYTEALMDYEEAPYFDRHYLEAPQAAGQSEVIFRFQAIGEDPGEMEGFWVIDNVSITADSGTPVTDWVLY